MRSLVLSLTGLLIYPAAILLPLLTFSSFGFHDSANTLESIVYFFDNSYYFVCFMVLISAVLFPLILLGTAFITSFFLYIHKAPSFLKRLFRAYLHLQEWAMVEIYFLGILITIIKMSDSANIDYQGGIFFFASLVLLTLTLSVNIDHEVFWSRIEQGAKPDTANTSYGKHLQEGLPGYDQGVLICETCTKILPEITNGKTCPRCGHTVHTRKVSSTTRTWALIITSALLLFPANILPIMQVNFLGVPNNSTILDGIIYFFQDGDYIIGFIIFCASVLVPIFKIIGLSILLLSRNPVTPHCLVSKVKMYRFIAFIGRWSMLDVFVIALLTGFVDFGFFTSIQAAPAATYFCIVVASTMFAAKTFDPRLLWDKTVSHRSQVCTLSKNVPHRPKPL